MYIVTKKASNQDLTQVQVLYLFLLFIILFIQINLQQKLHLEEHKKEITKKTLF